MIFKKKKDKEKPVETSSSQKKLRKKGEAEAEAKESETKKPKNRRSDRKLLKQRKDDVYKLKKDSGMKLLRLLFWGMLIFVFCRGLYQIVRPQKEAELRRLITEFRQEQQSVGDVPEEIMGFAEDFAKEYLTYSHSG